MSIKTYWTYEVICIDGEKRRSLVLAPCGTLAEAMTSAFNDATYYIGACGYKIALQFHELCATCKGTGLIHSKRTFAARHCKACKGNPIITDLPRMLWVPSQHVKISEAT